ncbi:MAG: hypothetical protein ABGZ17_07360, partial [Planctomycetaceae bacterium]
SVILPAGSGNLALVAEALNLVDRRDHWKVCFSTYFTRAVAGAQCQWRFLLDGTQESEAVRGNPKGILIDPAYARQPLPDGDPFVRAARGEDVDLNQADEPADPDPVSRGPMTKSQLRRRQAGARARRARLAARRPAIRRDQREVAHDTPLPPTRPQRGRRFWATVGGGTALAIVALYLLTKLL